MSGSRERVGVFLKEAGVAVEVREFDESTKNSELAAIALGCSVAQIAKSVVFVGNPTAVAVVVLSGDKRVDPKKLSLALGGDFRFATPAEVRQTTGYPVGGVPPFPHQQDVVVLPDESILRFGEVWAAAGSPNSVFKIDPRVLVRLVGRGARDLSMRAERI